MAKVDPKATGEAPRQPTAKEREFINAYLETQNACEAYRRSYTAQNMSDTAIRVESTRIMQRPSVSLAIKEAQQEAAETAVLSRSWVLTELMDNAQKAKGANDFTASNKALELLGKTDELQMFVERQKISGDQDNPLVMMHNMLSDLDGSTRDLPAEDKG